MALFCTKTANIHLNTILPFLLMDIPHQQKKKLKSILNIIRGGLIPEQSNTIFLMFILL